MPQGSRLRILLFPACVFFLFIGFILPLASQNRAVRKDKAGQEEKERVFLIHAKSAETYQRYGMTYRRVIGPARFLHNNTYFLCDTALLNTSTNIMDATGNIEIIQDGTRLLGERLHYVVDQDLAEVRGDVVELVDKDGNRLRTQYLDFNTADSVGHFYNGGSMVDTAGNCLESDRGYYESKLKRFRFYKNVEMSTDTVVVKADSIYYDTPTALARYWGHIQAWHTDGFIKSDHGWYNRDQERFNFTKDVYMRTQQQEAWAQAAEYDRMSGNALLMRDVQVVDTTRSFILLGHKADYTKSPQSVCVTDEPVAITYRIDQETHLPDSIFIKADTLLYRSPLRREADSAELAQAQARIPVPEVADTTQSALGPGPANKEEKKPGQLGARAQAMKDSLEQLAKADSLAKVRRATETREERKVRLQEEKAARKAAQAAEREAARKEAEALAAERRAAREARAARRLARQQSRLAADSLASDSLAVAVDSLALADSTSAKPLTLEEQFWQDDSLAVAQDLSAYEAQLDSVAFANLDSLLLDTRLNFFEAYHNVRVFKSNIQAACDSLVGNDIDSLLRLYGAPVLWNEQHQFSSDSMHFVLSGQELKEASFFSNAFIISQNDSLYFNQVKSKDMYAWFRDNDVYKYTAAGNFNAIFYLTEDSLVTNANLKDGQEMTVYLTQRRADRIVYSGSVNSNIYPLFVFSAEQEKLRDFNWRAEDRPMRREDITPRRLKVMTMAQRFKFVEPRFPLTKKYFPYHVSKFASARKGGVKTDARVELKKSDSLLLDQNFRRGMVDSLGRPQFVNDAGKGIMIDSLGRAFVVENDSLTTRDSLAPPPVIEIAADGTATEVAEQAQDLAQEVTQEEGQEVSGAEESGQDELAEEAVTEEIATEEVATEESGVEEVAVEERTETEVAETQVTETESLEEVTSQEERLEEENLEEESLEEETMSKAQVRKARRLERKEARQEARMERKAARIERREARREARLEARQERLERRQESRQKREEKPIHNNID